MQPSNWIALGSLIVAVVALLGSLTGYLLNRSGTRHAGEKAERAIIAAERSAAAHERTARATELQLIAAASSTPDAQAAWQLVRLRGDSFTLENVGTAPALAVEIEPVGQHVVFRDPTYDLSHIDPGEAVTFFAALTMGSTDDRIAVRWKDSVDASDLREWRRSLPPRH